MRGNPGKERTPPVFLRVLGCCLNHRTIDSKDMEPQADFKGVSSIKGRTRDNVGLPAMRVKQQNPSTTLEEFPGG